MVEAKEIQEAIKAGEVLFGYKESLKSLKHGGVKFVVIANNMPEEMRREIEHNANIGKVKVDVFSGNSKELGTFCGKPFPISVIAMKGTA